MSFRLAAVRSAFVAQIVKAGRDPKEVNIENFSEEELLQRMRDARREEKVVGEVGEIKEKAAFDAMMNRITTGVFTGEDDLRFLIRPKGSGSPDREG